MGELGKINSKLSCSTDFLYVYQRLKSRWELRLRRVIFAKFILGLTLERVDEPETYTLWLSNIAMENGTFIDDFPIKTSIYEGFSMAMLNNQMVLISSHFKAENEPNNNVWKCLKTTSQKLVETLDALKKGTVFLWISHWPKIQQW